MKREFIHDGSFVRVGIEIGEHETRHEDYLDGIKSRYDLDRLGFVLIKTRPTHCPDEIFYEWASFFAEKKIHFAFLYTQQRGAPEGEKSHLRKELVEGIRARAGAYFVGDMIGETGGLASWPEAYFNGRAGEKPPQGMEDMQQPKDRYVGHVADLAALDHGFGVENVLAVEATAFHRYNFEAGVQYTFLETMCGDPVSMLAFARGATRGYGRKLFGSHIAHEWYGGLRQDDPLKYKRLELVYRYAYLAGANFIYSESGDSGINSYGYHYDAEHPLPKRYREVWDTFAEWVRREGRAPIGPAVRVAFVHGHLDGYTGWGGATVWNQYGREEWGFGAAERSWTILKDIQHAREWHEPESFGAVDTSNAPAYGQYDVIPVETSADIMANYDYLLFAGWNTMTDALYENLKAYVAQGGTLFLTAAHLNTTAGRDGEIALLHGGQLADFLGCDLAVPDQKINSGVKFMAESMLPGVLYPGAGDLTCDPICAGGFVRYADVTLRGGRTAAAVSDSFQPHKAVLNRPVLVENRYGKGVVATLASLDYPGDGALYPLYRAIVREILSASHRTAPLQVIGSDRVAFAVYGDPDGTRTVYLLNTGYDTPATVEITAEGIRREVTVAPLELTSVVLKPQ